MKELLKTILEAIVDDTDSVKINEMKGENSIVFEVRVNPDEIGKIIGKSGRNAIAIRTVLMVAAAKHNLRCSMDILDS